MNGAKSFEFNLKKNSTDLGNYCSSWMNDYLLSQSAAVGIPGITALVNVLTEIIITFVAEWRKPWHHTEMLNNSISGIIGIQFINLSLVYIFANMNFRSIGFFRARFDDFSPAFWSQIAPQYVLAMIIEIAAPHGFPILIWMFYKCRKLRD